MFNRYFAFLEKLIPLDAKMPQTMPPQGLLAFAFHYLKWAKAPFIFVLVNSIFLALAESYIVMLVGQFVDILTQNPPQTLIEQHGKTFIFMLVFILIVKPVITFFDETVINQTIIPSFTNFVRWQNYIYVSQQSMSFFQNDFAGRLAHRIVQAGQALRSTTTKIINDLWFVIIYALSVIGLFAAHSAVLALPVVLWIVGYVFLLKWFIPRATETQAAASKTKSAILGRMVDEFSNIHTVKLFAREGEEQKGVRDAILRQTEANNAAMRVSSIMSISVTCLNAMLLASVGVMCLFLWQDGNVTTGTVAVMLTFAQRLAHISGWLMHTMRDVFENIGAMKDSLETIAQPISLVDSENAKPLKVTTAEVNFNAVTFHYGKGEGVLQNLSLKVKSGEKVGLVGISGAGKTTMMSLLLRLHDVESGEITIDGQNIAGVTQKSLRTLIGVVTQEPSLFHRSIEENIRFGLPSASLEEIIAAAKRAEAHEFILGLKDVEGRTGYAAHIGERGVKLSGGQRQRVAIARVLLKNAPLLVLDEATSALDSEIEAAIQSQLKELMTGKTVIAIAHRLSTIAMLDRLIVLDKGKIIESGTHKELLGHGGLYSRLWKRQSGGFLGE